MSRTGNTLGILALVAGGLYLLVNWARNAVRVTVGRPTFAFSLDHAGSLAITLPVDIDNGTPFSVEVTRFAGSLYYANEFFATVDIFQPVEIAANTSTQMRPVILVPLMNAAANIIEMVTSGNMFGVVKVRGYLYVNNGAPVLIDQTVQIAA